MARTPEQEEALAAAQGLRESLGGVRAELVRLNAFGVRNRHMIWITIAGVAVDIAATVVAVVAISVAAHANSRADQANARTAASRAANVTSCQASNVTRAGEVQLWDHLYTASTRGKESAKQRKANAQLIAYIRHLFRARNCTALYKGQ